MERVYCVHGVYFAVRSNSAQFMDRIARTLPLGSRQVRTRKVAATFQFALGTGDTERVVGRKLDDLAGEVAFLVASRAQGQSFLHAGVVAWQGKAIVIPGKSFSGKTSLVREFLKAGAEYYSDEYAVVDGRGYVHPFPRALRIRRGLESRSRVVSPESLGATVGKKALRVGMILLTKYQDGATWQPRLIDGGELVLKVMRNSVAVRRSPRETLLRVRRMVSTAEAFRGTRGNVREVVDWCLEHYQKKENR